ncbi:hypothetical protein BSL78_10270 [Apostichopus japonicus]|uniref:Uncharacterized protein n=1 Tax=Stichopus japonicus TaxID=307972 RepID=A0A2G8KXU2_STIJA|nr:hypothetical protein BSL78_10270 [Apostichopus japonicus]
MREKGEGEESRLLALFGGWHKCHERKEKGDESERERRREKRVGFSRCLVDGTSVMRPGRVAGRRRRQAGRPDTSARSDLGRPSFLRDHVLQLGALTGFIHSPREQRCPSVHTYISTFRYEAFADGSPPETRKGSLPVVRKYFCTSRLLLAFSVGSAVVSSRPCVATRRSERGFSPTRPVSRRFFRAYYLQTQILSFFIRRTPGGEEREEREREEEKRGEMKGRREKASRVAWWMARVSCDLAEGRAAGRRRRQAGPIHPQRSGSRSRIRDLVGAVGRGSRSERKEKGEMRDERERRRDEREKREGFSCFLVVGTSVMRERRDERERRRRREQASRVVRWMAQVS